MRQTINLNTGWYFEKDSSWKRVRSQGARGEPVMLPHTFQLEEPDVLIPWMGKCAYETTLHAEEGWRGKRVSFAFEGVMQYAEVYCNGRRLAVHYGGYLPFYVPLESLRFGEENRVTVLVSNEDDKRIPPGKPVKGLDFHRFSGIYRNVNLIIEEPLYIPWDGIMISTEWLAEDFSEAEVVVTAEIINEYAHSMEFEVIFAVEDYAQTQALRLGANERRIVRQLFTLKSPRLWSPDAPNLYELTITITNEALCSCYTESFGIKTLTIDQNGLLLNHEYIELNGANRHQQYPCLGIAASGQAQYRDAVKLKQAGFNTVRLSHYPQAPSFLCACDELGLMVIGCTPGWQFCRRGVFRKRVRQNVADMVKRDRNHACVILWETSLNETGLHNPGASDHFFAELNQIAKALSPKNILTCGDTSGRGNPKKIGYDVPFTEWDEATKTRPLRRINDRLGLNREYGDYEFGGHYSTTRAQRKDGEQALQQQAWNYQIALNRNRNIRSVGNIIWEGIDHTRGCGREYPISASGIFDIFRIPKPAYYFFRSQNCKEPMLHIANMSLKNRRVMVYSNCDEVELWADSVLVARQCCDAGSETPYRNREGIKSDIDYWDKKGSYLLSSNQNDPYAVHGINSFLSGGDCQNLRYPPFTFDLPEGTNAIRAIGFLGGKEAAEQTLRQSIQSTKLQISIDSSGIPLQKDGSDFVFVYASATDDAGHVDVSFSGDISFWTNGTVVGAQCVQAHMGVAAAVLTCPAGVGALFVRAAAEGLREAMARPDAEG